jgi:hypothetical protein
VTLLNDEPQRRRMAMEGFARVQRHFTVEQMVAETAAVYARVAGQPHAAELSRQEDRVP